MNNEFTHQFLIFGIFNKMFDSENIYQNILLLAMILLGKYLLSNETVKEKIDIFIDKIFSDSSNINKVKFDFTRDSQSIKCKSLFYFLSLQKSKDINIKCLIEDAFKKYNYKTDEYGESDSQYRVKQEIPFKFTDKILGKIYSRDKEDTMINNKTVYKEHITLEIYSYNETLENIKNFINDCKIKYDAYTKEKMLNDQYLINIESNIFNKSKNEDGDPLKIIQQKWSSNVTFDNRFFKNKEQISNIIDKFLYNEEWYIKKGIPHKLVILTYGEPGTGKTSFIKALANKTKRHLINIKLSDSFPMLELNNIIFSEEVDDDIVIPLNKKIIVLEDIDAMGEIIKDRDLKDEEMKKEKEKEDPNMKGNIVKLLCNNDITKLTLDSNNNLSYLLNILDGINEASGIIIVMSTNKIDKLDSAFIRPGRVDLKINLGKSDTNNIKDIFEHYWEDNLSDFDILTKYDNMFTPAELVDVCRKSVSMSSSINLLEELSKKL